MLNSPPSKMVKVMNERMNYRSDIDGLRAVAVLAVVLFHFNNSLQGGFAGVDVFFAISGYLMTGIILSGIAKKEFSVSKFYISRAKRIIPALTVLCLSLMIYGWFNLPPLDYAALSKHSLSSILFVSNFVYWQEAGYFDAASHEKWLLHTWSLSAEWQFYLIYPIILLCICKMLKGKSVGPVLLAMTIAGYLFSVYSSSAWPTSAYFLLPSRAWEMLAGGLAYVYVMSGKTKTSKLFHYVGLVLIVGSYFYVTSADQWPGYKAIIPVAGACLFLMSNYSGFISRFKPAIMIGKWSYSIYLWHWPVVVYCYLNKVDINPLIGLSLSVLIGYVSYLIVEKRRNIKLVSLTPFAAAISAVVVISNGYAYQMPKEIYNSSMLDPKSDEFGAYTWKNIKKLNLDFSGDGRKVLVIGDSTAGDFINMMLESNVHKRAQIRSRIVTSNCGSFFLDQQQRDELYSNSYDIKNGLVTKELCNKDIGNVFNDNIVKEADVIVISMNWRDYAVPALAKSLNNIKRVTNAKIFIIGSKSFQEPLPRIIYDAYSNKEDIGKFAFNESAAQFDINKHISRAISSFDDVSFIDLKSSMCDKVKKECVTFNNKSPVLYDSTHSTLQGVMYISKAIQVQMNEIR